jgi:hypothetical protein
MGKRVDLISGLILLDRPGNAEIQIELFYNYQNNLSTEWQSYFRKYQPPALVVWGKNDESLLRKVHLLIPVT